VKDFHVSPTSLMTASTSYGGGTNGAGSIMAQGGFEPYLSLFDSGGTFLASTLFGLCPLGAQTNTISNECSDVQPNGGALAAGDYEIAISAFENMFLAENPGSPFTLADGFTGLGNLAPGEDLHYAFDVVLTSATPVPEPSSAFLLLGGIAACLFHFKRKGRIP